MKNLFCLFFLLFFSGSLFAEDVLGPEYAECKLSFLSMISSAGNRTIGELLDREALITPEKNGGSARTEMEIRPGNPVYMDDGLVVEFEFYNNDRLMMRGGAALDFTVDEQTVELKASWFEEVGGEEMFSENYGDPTSMGETYGIFLSLIQEFFDHDFSFF